MRILFSFPLNLCRERKIILSENVLKSHLQILKVGALKKEVMGLLSLWSLGRLYRVGTFW
jgi:hypothetical protein